MRRALPIAAALLLAMPGAARAQRCTAPLPAEAGVPPTGLNPVILRVLGAPIIPVPATDGLVHLAYAAQVTNLAAGPARIVAFEPVDALRHAAPTGRNLVLDTAGAAITGQVRVFGLPPGDARDKATLAAGTSGVSFFDVTYPALAAVPERLAHRVRVELPGGASLDTLTDPVPVGCAPPVRLSPPLAGHGWWNGNGCCRTVNAHRSATLPLNGGLRVPEQFAVDIVQVRPDGSCCTGPVRELKSWPFYGTPVLAAAAGRVVAAVNDVPDQVPGPPQGVSVENAAGSHVIQEIGEGRWILYAHLIPGSVAVREGEVLRPGQVLGRLGNSGSSTAPHLHFQVMDRPSALNATGLPFVFDRLWVEGVVRGAPEAAERDYEAGRPVAIDRQGAGPRRDEMPAEGQVFGFHLE